MGRKARYKQEIERLIDIGYEAKDIVKITGIPKTTVYRHFDSLKKQARHDFNELLEKDYLYKYNLTLDNYSKSIQQCNEKLANIDAKYENLEREIRVLMGELPEKAVMVKASYMAQIIQLHTQKNNEMIKLLAQRDKSTELKAKVYNAGPVVQAVDQWIRDNDPKMGELPSLSLETQEIPQEDVLIPSDPEISEEDRKVLEEMERE